MRYDSRYLISHLAFTVGDLWSKTPLFQTYGIGYNTYSWLMETSLRFDDRGEIWKRPDTEVVRKSRRRRALKLNKKSK